MAKNLISGPILDPQIFFREFYRQGKLVSQTWENGEKPNYGFNLY